MATAYFTNEGHGKILQAAFQGLAIGNFYSALMTDTLSATDTWSGESANEVNVATNPGYARATVEQSAVGFPTLDASANPAYVQSKTCTFSATSAYASTIKAAVLNTGYGSDFIIAYANTGNITLGTGDSYAINWKLTLTRT